MTAVEVAADRMTGTVRVTLPREVIAELVRTLAVVMADSDGDAIVVAQHRCDLPDRELADLYDLTRDEADNRLSEALDAVLGLLPPTVWTMSARQAWELHDALYEPAAHASEAHR